MNPKSKSICEMISPCLTNIINKSLTTGVFRDNIKKSLVTPILKESDRCNLNNYRLISVLPVFRNIFEKVSYRQLYYYLKTISILHKQEYGFRAKKSNTSIQGGSPGRLFICLSLVIHLLVIPPLRLGRVGEAYLVRLGPLW